LFFCAAAVRARSGAAATGEVKVEDYRRYIGGSPGGTEPDRN